MAVPLESILELESLDHNHFRANHHRENFRKALFGGQVLAQGLMAAAKTVQNRLPHSLHAYFLKAGSSEHPIDYEVQRTRDGRSFTHRHVVAKQNDHVIFELSSSFHIDEPGFKHQKTQLGSLDLPSSSQQNKPDQHMKNAQNAKNQPFQFVQIKGDLFDCMTKQAPEAAFWLKSNEAVPKNSPIHHLCALAFASDLGLLASSLLPHEASLFDGSVIPASVDHGMWFHTNNIDMNDWYFYQVDSPWADAARGFSRGEIYNKEGKLIASTCQEGLIRPLKMHQK